VSDFVNFFFFNTHVFLCIGGDKNNALTRGLVGSVPLLTIGAIASVIAQLSSSGIRGVEPSR
jgi:hypothetical protein